MMINNEPGTDNRLNSSMVFSMGPRMKPEINKLDVKIVEAGNTTESNTQTPLRSNQNIISNATAHKT